jgi:hypothetical protein
MIRKGNIFHTEVQSDSAKRSSGTQKVKFDIDFLGCVECSTGPTFVSLANPLMTHVTTWARGLPNW